tara:strand:+ start:21100 stop:23922 length:2823 start_codon:yes stop_codon:yes gene_type:complete
MSINLKDSLNLPQTHFPMRANLVAREAQWIAKRESTKLYERIQEKNAQGTTFILHDGPPFTNGDVHIGTALNKILKDIVERYKSMRGYRTPYVPGWDCHGLPIEHKVMRELRAKKQDLDPLLLRKECAAFSARYIEKQRSQFKRLGVLADWDAEYKTMDSDYEAEILRTFASFVDQDLVYRSKKPVYWSIPCETALAEAEIEYKEHKSESIWVPFPLAGETCEKLGITTPCSVVIWTTTPWTLPANRMLGVHQKLTYVVVEHQGKGFVVAKELAESFIKTCELDGASLGKEFLGATLENLKAQHPFIDRESIFVLSEFVTTEEGSGCVHMAPGHGPEDYLVGKNYGVEAYCPLNDQGEYRNDGEIPEALVGLAVLDKNGKSPANKGVLALLEQKQALLHKETIQHQYPHCWRSKTPVIFRAMPQWFVALDKEGKRQTVMDSIEKVNWMPQWGQKRISGAVESRPDWCISRQRSWGVPIPVFYDEEGNALLDAAVIEAIAQKVEKRGTDLWYEASAEELLEGVTLPDAFAGKSLKKGMDTLDVWIDSGCSHRAVLKKRPQLQWPADLYLEGSDQHRGWFQSSLWTSQIADGDVPYKSIITHGFVVGGDKKKISKSDGKPQTADSYIKQYGADVVRLWIASEDYRNDIPLSDDILKQVVQTYRTIRNTLRFQLGNLCDFEYEVHAQPFDKLEGIDAWALHQTADLIEAVTQAYEEYQFHKAYQLINRFCAVTLSAIYHDILKDRLYTFAPEWTGRRASQTVIYHVFHTLLKLLAPILSFTTDEAFAYFYTSEDFSERSIHLESWPEVDPAWRNSQVTEEVNALLKFRDSVNEKLEEARQSKLLGQSMDAQIVIRGAKDDEGFKLLSRYEKSLPEFFIVSQVVLEAEATGAPMPEVKHAEGVRCPRSWRWVPELVMAEPYGEISPRCRDALLMPEKDPSISSP